MDQHYKNFIRTLYNFLHDSNRYVPTEAITNILSVFDKLDMTKVIFRTYHLLKDNSDKLKNKDETLFDQSFIIIPGVDVSPYWSKLIKGQKDKLWTYMNILMITSDLLMNVPQLPIIKEKEEMKDIVKIEEKKTIIKEKEEKDIVKIEEKKPIIFDPFIGVGNDDNESDGGFSVNELYSSVPTLDDDKPDGPGLDTVIKMIGFNNMINMEEIINQLKNMKKEDIDNATNSIMSLLGNQGDEKTTQFISDMLSSVSEEMKNNDLGKGDPFENIQRIAEVVAEKMRPSVEKNGIDIGELVNTTQMFASQCKDKNGNPIFGNGMNPFSLLEKLTGSNGPASDDQCMKQCNEMLQKMGITGMNMKDLSNQMQNRNTKNTKKIKKYKKGKKPYNI